MPSLPNHLISTLAELRAEFPGIDFDNEYHLLDETGWESYEEGAVYYLFHHVPTDRLMRLDCGNSVYSSERYGTDFLGEIHPETFEAWEETVRQCDAEVITG
jgi:hypothetical protein